MTRRHRALTAIGILAAAAGCYDLIAPTLREPELVVNASAFYGDDFHYQVVALYRHGTGADGRPVELSPPTLRIQGAEVLASPPTVPSESVFQRTWSLPRLATAVDRIQVEVPPASNAPATGFTVTVPLPRRRVDRVIDLARGSDLAIEILLPPVFEGLSEPKGTWRLAIAATCTTPEPVAVTSGDIATLRTAMVVPAAMIASLDREWFEACLTVSSEQQRLDVPYATTLTATTRMVWRVNLY